MTHNLITPHGGSLCTLFASEKKGQELLNASKNWPSWSLTPRQSCDLELLLNGAFSPLQGFMNKNDYDRVLDDMHLENGTLWTIPITLDVTEKLVKSLTNEGKIVLRDQEGVPLAILSVGDIWRPNKDKEALAVYETTDLDHPGVNHLMKNSHDWYIGGTIQGLNHPRHYDFCSLRLSPEQFRKEIAELNWEKVVAFQTRNPLHRVHQELTLQAIAQVDAKLLLHPVIGMTKPGDIDQYTRVRCYQALINHYPEGVAKLGILPLSMRMAGPREALWHAIIRKNFGCTHFIIGRDHASPGCDSQGKPYYGPFDAHELFEKHSQALGIEAVKFQEMRYVNNLDKYLPVNEIPKDTETSSLSGTELRRRLKDGEEIPSWFSYAEVVEELRKTHPPRKKAGLTLFFTGLSGSGKSTLGNILAIKLLEMGSRPVTLLDGDVVRKYLSSELSFSKQDRDINIRRIGYVASEITKNRGIAICAPIAPYDETRKEVRNQIDQYGNFLLIHLSTSLKVCEERDVKGMYAKARSGLIEEFTGISDPYETPADAELTIDTDRQSPEDAVDTIIAYLKEQGYIEKNAHTSTNSSD